MILTVGNKVIYPCQGPCLIGPIIRKIVDGTPTRFYHLVVLDEISEVTGETKSAVEEQVDKALKGQKGG